jgi:hypothetical protein
LLSSHCVCPARVAAVVASSFCLSYLFQLAALGMLWFLPDQKAEAQARKQHWPKHPKYAVITVTMLSLALVYSVTVNFLAMTESTMCLRIVGGDGCDGAAAPPPTSAPNATIFSNGTVVCVPV